MNEKKERKRTKVVYGLLAGLLTYSIIGSMGLYGLSTLWADYALASTHKSYTVEMKLARLVVGLLASIGAGIISTMIANDNGKTAWFVGLIIFSFAGYTHLFRVWADYPVWYHFAYLLPILPLTGLSHYFIGK